MATRGRKPVPTALKLLRNNPGKRPIQEDSIKPPVGAPERPDFLTGAAAEEWDRLVIELEAMGLVTQFDRAALAAYCQAYGRWLEAEAALKRFADADPNYRGIIIRTVSGNMIQNPAVGAANRAMELMLKAAVEFGMTPSARSRVSTTGSNDKEGNPFARNGKKA